jgi:pimeloyl-ACP methyl ester carboxylesterase
VTANLTRAPLEAPTPRKIADIEPVSDEVYNAYRILYEYSPVPLNATLEGRDSERLAEHELVEVDAAYPGSRLPIHMYLPTSASPPYQVVVYWPGSIVNRLNSYEDFKFQLDFVLKSGRAVAFPIYDATFGRHSGGRRFQVTDTADFREILSRTVKDMRRTVDYLESRPDIDTDRIAFFGHSMGAYRGVIGVAVDKRIRAVILYTLAILEENPPDADPLTYLPYISQPTLMLSGAYDPIAPLDLGTRPAFDRIGATAPMKRLVVAPSGHFVPRDIVVRESLGWLDKHFGSARRK